MDLIPFVIGTFIAIFWLNIKCNKNEEKIEELLKKVSQLENQEEIRF